MEIFVALSGAMALWTSGFWMGIIFVVAFICMSFSVTHSYRSLGNDFEAGYTFTSLMLVGLATGILHLASIDLVTTLGVALILAVITTVCKFIKHVLKTKRHIESEAAQIRIEVLGRVYNMLGDVGGKDCETFLSMVFNKPWSRDRFPYETKQVVGKIATWAFDNRLTSNWKSLEDFTTQFNSTPDMKLAMVEIISMVSQHAHHRDIWVNTQGGIEVRSKDLSVRAISWFFVWPFVAIELCFGSFLPAIASFFASIFGGFTNWLVRSILTMTGLKI